MELVNFEISYLFKLLSNQKNLTNHFVLVAKQLIFDKMYINRTPLLKNSKFCTIRSIFID